MLLKPPIIALLYLILSLGLHFLFPNPKIIHSPYKFLGIIPLGFGIFIMIWAVQLFKKKETSHDPAETPTTLVTSGPYRFTRNPMYLGMTSILLGIAIFIGTISLFLAPLAFCITINATFIPKEEKILENIFGSEYLDYKNKVRRWV